MKIKFENTYNFLWKQTLKDNYVFTVNQNTRIEFIENITSYERYCFVNYKLH